MKLSEYIHHQLAAAGATRAFGVPGYFVMPTWQAFTADPRIVLSRHESGAGFMADGHYRAGGGLGVVLATSGPGLVNCVTGVACAYRDSIPLIVITGQAPVQTFGRGAFLESYVLDRAVSPSELMSAVTKKSIEIVDLANAAFLVDSAIGLALSGRPGPVHLSIPVDLQHQEIAVPAGSAGRYASAVGCADPARLAAAADLIAQARRPMILAGWGSSLSGAGDEISRLAAEIGAVVVCTTKAHSVLPSHDPSRVGHVGPGQRSDIVAFLSAYDPDLVLVAGASLSSFYAQPLMELLAAAKTVRIDADADQILLRHRADVAAVGDVAASLGALRDMLADRLPAPDRDRAADRQSARTAVASFQETGRQALARQGKSFDGLPSMAGVIATLSALLPPDTVVVPDAGNHWLDTISLSTPMQSGGLQLNCGIGAMGWATGAAVGIAMARGPRKTVCITGDGSVLMSGGELSLAAEHGLDLLVLIFNNGSHGRVRIGQDDEFDGAYLATDLPSIDFAAITSAMGLTAFRVGDPDEVEGILRKALDIGGPVVVEVICSARERPAVLRDWIAS